MSVTHWTTREVAQLCGLAPTTLRWYERIGLIDHIERGTDSRRRYSQADIDWIRLLSRLRATGMPVKDMQRYAAMVRSPDTQAERLELFREHRRRLLAALAVQNECLALVERKIEHYSQAVFDRCGTASFETDGAVLPETGEEIECELSTSQD